MAGNKKKSGKRGCGKHEEKPTLKAMKRVLIRKTKKPQLSAGRSAVRRKQNPTKEGKSGVWEVSDHVSAKAKAIQSLSSAPAEVVIQPGILQQLTRNSSLSGSAQLNAPHFSVNHINKSMKRRRQRIDDDPQFFSNAFSALPVMGDGAEDDEEPAKVVIAPGRLQLPFDTGLSLSTLGTSDSGINEATCAIVRESSGACSGKDYLDDNDI